MTPLSEAVILGARAGAQRQPRGTISPARDNRGVLDHQVTLVLGIAAAA